MSTTASSPRPSRLFRPILIPIATIVVLGILALLLIPGGHANPPVVSEPNWDSPQTRELAVRACYDCHSNETIWPWYSYVPPFSVAISHEVQEGREILNFSDWEHVTGEGRSAGEMIEKIREGEMPPAQYAQMHPEAVLTNAEEQVLIDGLRATISQSGGSAAEGEEDEGEDDD